MTFRTYCRIAKGRIDPAPMVDVVFLLMIFLVLSSPFVLQPGHGVVDLPESREAKSASFQGLVVVVSRDNLVFFQNQSIALEKLPEALQAAAKQARGQELVIKADRQVSNGTVVQIMDMAFAAGITAVNLATRPGMAATAKPR